MYLENALIGTFAVWRVTHLLHAENGPYGTLQALRQRAGTGFWGQVLGCFYCLSLWVAAPACLLIGAAWPAPLVLWPALSGAACLLQRATEHTQFPSFFHEDKE